MGEDTEDIQLQRQTPIRKHNSDRFQLKEKNISVQPSKNNTHIIGGDPRPAD